MMETRNPDFKVNGISMVRAETGKYRPAEIPQHH